MDLARAPMLVVAACALTTACGSSPSSNPPLDRGDCGARLVVDGETYRPMSTVRTPRRDAELGSGTFLDCDGSTLSPDDVAPTTAYRIDGVDPERALLIAGAEGDQTYLNTRFPYADRPALIKDAGDYPACTGPARFTGTWLQVDAEDMPTGDDFDLDLPFHATFTARTGDGLELERWNGLTLRARFTEETGPAVTPEFVERALTRAAPVDVELTCDGAEYMVSTIHFAPEG